MCGRLPGHSARVLHSDVALIQWHGVEPVDMRENSGKLTPALRIHQRAFHFPHDPSAGSVPGVFDGEWYGSGEELVSKCPATGEVLAKVRGVSEGWQLGYRR